MEAVWIRFFPIMLEIKDLLHQKRVLGKILRMQSEFCMKMPTDPKHRLNNPDLAGGAILDMGIYPLTWQLNIMYEDPDNKMVEPQVTSSLLKSSTGVDQYTTMLFNWPQLNIQTMATCNVRTKTRCTSILVKDI
jgi:predicted dehydrogenase